MTDASHADPNLAQLQAIESDIAAGRLREAGAAIRALAAAAPGDVRVYFAGALLARAARNLPAEIDSLRRAAVLAPDRLRVRIDLAKALSRNGNHADAVATANAAVAAWPTDMAALEVAVAVAYAAGDPATMQGHLESALALRPGDATIHRSLAICLAERRLHADAEAHWRAVLAQAPDDSLAWGGLGGCLIELDRREEARAALKRALELVPGDPSLEFFYAMACGETPRTQPKKMMQDLFDRYAARFDRELVGQLKYRVPKRVAEIIKARSPALDVSILDLGCGTGLLGVYLGRIAGAFVGVDVAAKMIEQATQHRIYTEFRQTDLLEELRATAPATYDYVTANDVFIYVGDLSAVIPAAFDALRSGGALIFSCETAEEAEGALVLRRSKRYAHSRSSVEALCRQAGFALHSVETLDLRLEKDERIPGYIVVAEKP